ncbi:hypothetical protein Ahy_B01g054907 [Arachis hypogaea]|uniref:CCHC-type domain-containing protein n=1 Tax=Arachis hypogaea TaxID=3818 RepID=A0A445AUH5_ARAHY|nr:hypothetical protein Ahy_B01g054907 [Arachis hypogaea]
MKRVYKEGSCCHCGGKRHDKRNCAKKKADEAAAAAGGGEADTGNQQQSPSAATEVQDEDNATEIEVGMSQPIVSEKEKEDSYQARPPKLPQKEDNLHHLDQPQSHHQQPVLLHQMFQMLLHHPMFQFQTLPPTTARIDPMVGASAATVSRLRNVLRFVPTPDFKPPRKFKK